MTGRIRRLVASVGVIALLAGGCRPAALDMRPGTPVEVKRGYCFLETEYKQGGQRLKRDSVMQQLARSRSSAPYVKQGNTYAVASILATIASTSAVVVGVLGRDKTIEMRESTSTALIAGGFAAGVLSWALCITSDGKYAAAAEAYSNPSSDDSSDEDAASDPPETWETDGR